MFSQASVGPQGGGGLPSHNAMGQADPPQKADPPKYSQLADGTHPTGMLFECCFESLNGESILMMLLPPSVTIIRNNC